MLFGIIKNYDETKGVGWIKAENGHIDLQFEKSDAWWGDATRPKVDQRLSYEIGKNKDGTDCAVNLRAA